MTAGQSEAAQARAERLARIVELRAQGLTWAEIGDAVGLTQQYARAVVAQAGGSVEPLPEHMRRRSAGNEALTAKIVALRAEGLPFNAIAERLGISADSARERAGRRNRRRGSDASRVAE